MVHQHFTLADNLTVLDNIMVGTESLWKLASGRRLARRKLVELGQRFGLGVDPDARVGTLSVGEKQRVEILKALYRGARVLILDEPTAVLTPQEVDGLFATLRGFVDEGLAVIFISHKLDEVMAVSRRVAVLRQGRLVAERDTAATTPAELAELMVGRKVAMPHAEAVAAAEQAAPVIALSQVTVRDRDGATRLDSLDLTVHRHEIVAIAGVAGNGQQALVSVLTGLRQPSDGAIRLGPERAPRTPAGWTAARVGRIPEDRHGEGMIGDSPLWENAIVEDLNDPRFARWGMIRARAGRLRAGAGQAVRRARRLAGRTHPQPVRRQYAEADPGPHAGPRAGLHRGRPAHLGPGHRRRGLCARTAAGGRRRGAGVLLVSEDLEEIFALADRIAVLCGGKLVDVKPVAQWTPASVGLAMTGTRA